MRILVAGAGNIFLRDDGFGVEVAQRLLRRRCPERVRILDVGIRGIHLAYELLDGYDALVLVDAVTHGEPPGTVSVFERTWDEVANEREPSSVADAHDLSPDSVLSLLAGLGGRVDRVITVGCEPGLLEEGIGLSAPVAEAVEPAVLAVDRLVARLLRDETDRRGGEDAGPIAAEARGVPR